MKFEVITIFPNIFENFTNEALISRAIKKKIISIKAHNLRKWTKDAHKTARPDEHPFGRVDDRPYGGGAGMVLRIEPLYRSVQSLSLKFKVQSSKLRKKERIILLSAKGKVFNQKKAQELAKKYDHIIFICGRYEGVDERVAKYVADEELSIGEYVLFGGEVPAMVVMEAVTRLLPGTIGKQESVRNESFSQKSNLKKLVPSQSRDQISKIYKEHPHYTRPEVFKIKNQISKIKILRVPKVLLSGDHKKIENWRNKNAKSEIDK